MEKNVIICITEGPHDAAFLYKIIKSNDFKSYKKTLKDLPSVISNLLSNPRSIANKKIEDLKVDMANRRLYPFNILTDGSNLILLYPLLGKDNILIRKKLINTIDDLIILNDPFAADFTSDIEYTVLYFWDADKDSIKIRINKINEELKSFYDNKVDGNLQNYSFLKINNINFGAYIFTEPQKEFGNLENILIPLMRNNNEDIFGEAEKFLSIHENTTLFKGKLEYDENSNIKKVNKTKFDFYKSLIGTVGQLQKSGMNNTVCITQTDYLNKEKILKNKTCIEIMNFIKNSF